MYKLRRLTPRETVWKLTLGSERYGKWWWVCHRHVDSLVLNRDRAAAPAKLVDRRHQSRHCHQVDYAFQIVGQHRQAHFGADFL